MSYYCKKCKYEHKKEKLPFRCPYCSTVGSMVKKESAQDLLNDVFSEISQVEQNKQQRQNF